MGRSGSASLVEDLDLPESPHYLIKQFQGSDDNLVAKSLNQRLFEAQVSILYKVGQHPQIPALVAKFEEDGNKYLVREYIEGELLSQELAQDFIWTQTQVFDFLMDLMGILSFVHSFKYIHQDINPKNIIRRKDNGRFSLIGFSAAKDLGSVQHNIPSQNSNGQVNIAIGTPGYIPYEQEQNISQFNSDIYAVGVIAIQALTNKFPISQDPRSYELSWRDGVNINLRLMNIIDKMVRPDYRNRYQSALEVLGDLESFALTQIPPSKFDKLKPYLFFGMAASTLLIGFSAMKWLSAAANKPQLSPSVSLMSSTPISKDLASNRKNNLGWQTYLDPSAKVKIKYYPTWHLEDIHNLVTGENVLFSSPQQNSADNYRENVSIRVENLTNSQTSLADYTKSAIAEIGKYYKEAKVVESSSILLSKKPANLVVYTGKDENGIQIKNLEVWTIDRGKAYILTYKAEPTHYYTFLQTVMTMINSFELTN